MAILYTQAEYGASSGIPQLSARGVMVHINRQPPSGQSRRDRATKLRADGVRCRVCTGTGPEVPKVVLVTGAAFSGFTMDQLMCASLFPHPLTGYVLIINNNTVV